MIEFKPEDREIFKYHTGDKAVCGDPELIRRRIYKALGEGADLRSCITDLDSEIPELSQRAYESLLPAIHEAFNVRPLTEDGEGVTEREAFAILFDWIRWMNDLKKKESPSPSSSPSAEGESSPAAA